MFSRLRHENLRSFRALATNLNALGVREATAVEISTRRCQTAKGIRRARYQNISFTASLFPGRTELAQFIIYSRRNERVAINQDANRFP